MRLSGLRSGLWVLTTLLGTPESRLAAQPADSAVSTGAVSTGAEFTAAQFYDAVVRYHPLVRQAALFGDEARQEIVQARGAFDPKLFSYYDRKEFNNDLYYARWGSGLSIPILPGGLDLKVTYDRNQGKYLNPEEIVPRTGLTGVGINVPIGQGLLIDARRNTLRQARLLTTLAEADRRKLVNKTLYDAAKTYWEWYLAHRQYELVREGYGLADTRFRALRQRALLGDAAIIDTTEALITVQDRLVQFRQADVEQQNARVRLTAFLWAADGQAVDMPPNVVPQPAPTALVDETMLQTYLDRAAETHPDLVKLATKGQQLAIEERFRRSLLRPQINLAASLISRTPSADTSYPLRDYYQFRPQDHKVTVDFLFPLFLRKERGKLRQVQIKAEQLTLERQQTTRDIAADVRTAYNDLQTLDRQIAVQQQTVANQRTLVRAEQQKFEMGESSLFLVNARESKLIDLGVKLEELRSKYQKAVATLWYVAGTNGAGVN